MHIDELLDKIREYNEERKRIAARALDPEEHAEQEKRAKRALFSSLPEQIRVMFDWH